jgi:hypothetical protein
MVVVRRTMNLNAVEPAQSFKIPGVRVTRDPDTFVRLMLHVAKDHHNNNPEYRFRLSGRRKPKQKRGLSCRFYSGKISFLRVEDLSEVGPELHFVNGEIITSPTTVLVADLLPAINTKNELLFQITATASSEADGEALGTEEPADFTDEI